MSVHEFVHLLACFVCACYGLQEWTSTMGAYKGPFAESQRPEQVVEATSRSEVLAEEGVLSSVTNLQVLALLFAAFNPLGARVTTHSGTRVTFTPSCAQLLLGKWRCQWLPRVPDCVASIIEVVPPGTLPADAADKRLEALLLRVLTAEDTGQEGETPEEPSTEQLLRDLEAAGYQLVGESEVRLAETLQPTAAERLTVQPQLGQCDALLAVELGLVPVKGSPSYSRALPFDGRVLIWRRGYGSEGRVERLVLEKLDYLQASLVSRALEPVAASLESARDAATNSTQKLLNTINQKLRGSTIYQKLRGKDADGAGSESGEMQSNADEDLPEIQPVAIEKIGLKRSSLADALQGLTPDNLLSKLLGPTSLSEPTFDELVVMWREPAPRAAAWLRRSAEVGLPTILEVVDSNDDGVVDLEEIADVVRSPNIIREALQKALAAVEDASPPPPKIEVSLFRAIPIANFALVLPFSKPSFTASDWLRLDLVSVPALLAALATLRFEDARLTIAATSAVVIWAVRTLLSYRNAINRYEVLLNRFLKDKVELRGVRSVASLAAQEAKAQRARRAAALFGWLQAQSQPLPVADVLAQAKAAIGQGVPLETALNELRRLKLVQEVPDAVLPIQSSAEQWLEVAPDAEIILRERWNQLLGEWPFSY